MSRRLLMVVLSLLSCCASAFAQAPGRTANGTLLPNGWTLTPEGAQIPVSDLPLNMVLSRDGRHLLVTTNGNGVQTIDVIDVAAGTKLQSIVV